MWSSAQVILKLWNIGHETKRNKDQHVHQRSSNTGRYINSQICSSVVVVVCLMHHALRIGPEASLYVTRKNIKTTFTATEMTFKTAMQRSNCKRQQIGFLRNSPFVHFEIVPFG